MSMLKLTEASSGAPRNAGTNGDLVALMDWALPQAGWTIEATSGNARIYRPPAGNRQCLFMNHDSSASGSAGLCLVRGCDPSSTIASLVDPFPQVAQVANTSSNWHVSTSANTTSRGFIILVTDRFVLYASDINGSGGWDFGFFGDLAPAFLDAHCTAISVRSNPNIGSGFTIQQPTSPTPSAGINIFFSRDITGATKSTRGILNTTGTGLGSTSSCPAARAGYQNAVVRERVAVACSGAQSGSPTTLAINRRGYVPNLWNGVHLNRGTLNSMDTFGDSAYDPTANFIALVAPNSSNFVIVEDTDTWTPP